MLLHAHVAMFDKMDYIHQGRRTLSQWKKQELEAYLSHHKIAKTGNKPELLMRVSEHMHTTTIERQ